VRDELIEGLITTNRNEDAGDLLAEAKDDEESVARAFDCYVKANAFQKAIKFATMTGQVDKIETVIKPTLLIALDLKSNLIKSALDTFGKRYLRLKIV